MTHSKLYKTAPHEENVRFTNHSIIGPTTPRTSVNIQGYKILSHGIGIQIKGTVSQLSDTRG